MSFDQSIRYKVSLDDADFQSKLSQLRANIDSTVGGGAGFGGGMNMMGAMFAPSGFNQMGGGNTSMMMSGLADFGSQVRPITYTPPAIAMQPHFGQIALQQTTGQAFLGAMGPMGLGVRAAGNFISGNAGDVVPPQISIAEFSQLSARAFGTRFGDALSTGALVTAGTAAGILTGGAGAAIGERLIGGMIGGLAGGIAGGLPASMLMNEVGDMMANNRSVQTQLEAGSFRFISGGKDVDPLTGRGFGRRARAEVADFVQSQELKDVRFGMPEMKQILESGMQMDMFSGTSDIEDFKSRFKGMVETIKTISSTLHTSIKEGMEVMRGFRDMGITNPGTVQAMTQQAESMGRMSGRTGMEMLSIGQAGAEMFRGTGVRMGLGFELNMANTTLVRQMLNEGLINREMVGQAGGENALAQQMTGAALGSTQTAMGRGVMMANFNPATGGLDPNFIGNMMGKGAIGLVQNAARLAGNPQALMSFQAHQEDIVSAMSPMQLEMFSMAADMGMAKTVTDSISGTKRGTAAYSRAFEENFIAMERRQGVPIEVIKTRLAMAHTDPEKMRDQQEAAIESMATQGSLEYLRNRFNPLKQLSNWARGTFVQPAQELLTGISTRAGIAVDEMAMTAMGANVVHGEASDRAAIKRGQALIEARGGVSAATRGTELGVIDVSGSVIQRALGGGQSGESLAATFKEFGTAGTKNGIDTLTYQGMTAMRFKTVDDVKRFNAQTGQQMHILTHAGGLTSGGTAGVIAIPTEQLAAGQKQLRETTPNQADIDAADKFKITDQQKIAVERLIESGKVDRAGMEQAIFGAGPLNQQAGGYRKEVLTRIAKEKGLSKLSRELEGGDISSAAGKGAAMTFNRAEEVIKDASWDVVKEVGGGFRSEYVYGQLSSLQKGIALTAMAEKDKDKRTLEMAHLRESGASEEQMKAVQSMSGNLSGMQRINLRMNVEKFGITSAVGALEKQTARGATDEESKNITGTGAIGKLTGTTLQQMSQMSEQLKNNMEMLVALQKQFKENLK